MATFPDIAPALEPYPLADLAPNPLVSVLLANFNYARFIEESLNSVKAQTYQNWELIICDDGSTDDSVTIIKRCIEGDRRIELIEQPNGGHTSALNAAYKKCRGSIICFLDSDDLFLPEKMEQVVAQYRKNRGAGMLVHRVIRVDEARQREGVWPLSTPPDGWLAKDLLKAGGVLTYAAPTSGITLRREIAERLFPISTEAPLNMCPDQVVMRLAPLLTEMKREPGAFSEFRVHNKNAYSRQGVSASDLTRQLVISKALWKEQHRFLQAIDPALAGQLTPLEEAPFTALLQYMEARFRGDENARGYHKKYLASCEGMSQSKSFVFWKYSIYLPTVLFRPAVRLVTGQNVLKQFLARLRQLA